MSTHATERATDLSIAGAREGVLSAVPAWLSLVIVPFVALAAALGLLLPGLYRDTQAWVSQARWQDLVTLLVGVPLLVVGLIGARRGSVRCLLVAVALAAYLRLIRPWQLGWGATDAEVAAAMPGDDRVQRPTFNATRAVTIAATPEQIWPWLIQIGLGRAGWYSYDWLDNLGRHSAEQILPDFQHVAVGDVIPLSPDGKQGQWVKAFEPNRWMLWGDKAGDSTWCWGLNPVDERHTRLLTRVRMCYRWTSLLALFNPLVEFTDIVLMRKCLLGIKRRAEASTLASPRLPVVSRFDERESTL